MIELIALVILLIATICDLRTKEVPDELSYGLMGIALLARLIFAFNEQSFSPLLDGLLGFGIFFGIGYALYKTNQWGGADAKILGGLGGLFGFSLTLNDFMLAFFVNLMAAGAIYGLIYAVFIAWKKKPKIRKVKYFKTLSGVSFSFIVIGAVILPGELKILFTILVLLIYSTPFAINFVNGVQNTMQRRVKPSVLTEGDWVGEDVKYRGKLICRKKDNGLTKKQLAKLNSLYDHGKIKKVLLKEGIPFLPSFLIAFVATYLFGNLFLVLVNFL